MADAAPLVIWIEGWVPPTLNRTLAQHWSKRRTARLDTAWRIRAAVKGALPREPMPRARVEIERRSWSGPLPDTDGMIGGCKGLIDCLLPCEVGRPYGLGFVLDDKPEVMELHVRAKRVPKSESGTMVTITPL